MIDQYWRYLVLNVRGELGIGQSQLAKMIGTQQTNISRWEGGKTIPSRKFQKEIEILASGLGLASITQVAALVTHSPFHMVLLASDRRIIATSVLARNILSKTHTTNESLKADYLFKLDGELNSLKFWEQSCQKIDILIPGSDCVFKTIVTSVIVHGEKYALAQIEIIDIEVC
jgi:transcriptional regulator with XRE-family HTH domain